MPSRPLDGIRVLDLSRLLPGPFASLVLADLGAQVDKIEDPDGGDYLRVMPPMQGDTSSMFLALNRNKRSACLDLKKEGGRQALLALARRYDVVLEQFRPGVLDRLGLGHRLLLETNPRLVVCALTGYGQDGPLAKRAGHDLNYLARAGVLGMCGPADGPPQVPGFQLADIGGGLWCVAGILAALQRRSATGEGSVVDVSMLESSMAFAFSGFGQLFGGSGPPRGAGLLTGGLALYGTYATRDGRFVTLAALEPKFWLAFCAGAGLEPDMGALFPGPHQGELKAKLRALFVSRTRAEWEAFGRQHDCCLEPVLEPEELEGDEQLRARGAFFEIDSPWGRLQQLRTPLTEPGAEHTPPPRQGEHTDAILREAGIDDAVIAAMRAEGSAR
ncbi:MAG TPA: CaiB/BaiF CoA-transferase family protein [Polyangiaceae bacterium]|nr:CaiB/BaiF CoA-transferase family protein [Polyangiaceae bacterium]